MKCQFCSNDVKEWDGKRVGYLIASTSENGGGELHTHVHGTMSDKDIAQGLIDASIDETGLGDIYRLKYSPKPFAPKEVVFHNRQRIGDMIMFTCGIRDFKAAFPQVKVGVISTAMHIWDNNPYVDLSIPTREFEAEALRQEAALPEAERKKKTVFEVGDGKLFVRIGPQLLTNASNRIDWHFANAFRYSMEQHLGISIKQGESRGDIWLTEDEYNAPRITDKPYWVIITGGEKGWGCKMYPTVRWQKVVEMNPDILFYQLGALGDNHVRLQGPNVVDLIGKTEHRDTGLRDLIKLFLNAEGSIGLVSFHMHLSGALKKPAVVVAGAREPVSFTRYAGHQYLATDGCLPCATTACWHCDLSKCTNRVVAEGEEVPRCVDMISPEDVSQAIRRYYDGGLLSYTKPSAKPKLANIVKKARVVVPNKIQQPPSNPLGFEWGGGSITDRDWAFMQEVMAKHSVKSVLEFGAGLSTLLLNDNGRNVVTYETNEAWIKKVTAAKPCNIQKWDGVNLALDKTFDMAFVDGPAGDINRDASTRIAALLAKIVVVHDAGREFARKYQEEYLAPLFDGPVKGGHRCHLWTRRSTDQVAVTTAKKSIKFVSTARGWGGCARSITTIMRLLLQAGHDVEFIPFRKAVTSHEFQKCISTDLQKLKVTTNYEAISQPCDVLFVYADDYIWEFGQPEMVAAFSNLQAKKRIMMLNYRRGGVGEVAWTRGWDKYMFLNSTQEKELLKVLPGVSTMVLPPCIELDAFLMAKPNFEQPFHKELVIRVVRHSSQGDTKFAKDFGKEIDAVLDARPDVTIAMLPGPSFVESNGRFRKLPRTANPTEIAAFLEGGNLFWYSLPAGYMDMGPRVILEAMAAGLPILADNWGGAVDRVTPECGWLCDTKEQMVDIIKNVTLEELAAKGVAARKRAKEFFVAQRWIDEIIEA